MWTGVVAPWSLDVPPEERSDAPPKPGEKPRQREKAGAANYHFWIHDRQMSAYARAAIVKTGELLSGLKEHKMAAEAFRTYLDLYPPAKPRHGEPPPPPDDLYYISRYMLGQEQIALSEIEAMTKAYKPFLTGERTDRFRLAALRFMGFHASSGEWMTYGVEAYATILDEYGTNEKDVDGKPIPIPVAERIRQGDYGWDGIRMPPPQGLDLGQVRYALGFLYWKNGQWAECIRALLPFAKTADLITSKSRDRALYMVAQSYYRTYDFASGINVLWMLVTQCPTFEAIEEAYAEAGKGCVRTRNWKKMDEIYARFMKEHPASSRRPHMDLYAAIAATQTGRIEEGARQLKGIARSDAYEDVKADAYYQLGLLELATPTGATGGATGGFKPELAERNYRAALADFEKSIELYPREQACLAAARACVSLGEWDRARSFLNRALSDFAEGDRATIEEAKSLLQRVLKEAAKEQEKGK
jgi:tetratricopeptide (TPR) repeat protein